MTSKKKQLLIESSEFTSKIKLPKKLKESVKLSAGKNGTLIVRNIPVTILNRKNQNGRIYSTSVVQAAVDNAKMLIETKQLLSQACEHPEGSFVSPTTASHVIIGAYIKKGINLVVEGQKGKFDVLFNDWEVLNTTEGKNLRALFEAECSIGTSIRGVGDLDGEQVIDYEFLGCDCVGNPSSSTYTRMPVSESVKVELVGKEPMSEGFVVTTASTNVVGDLDKASVIQAQLDNATYGTVIKTSTKLDSEVDPKTGATTSITTLEAETEDEVADLDQALVMAKNAMLNGLVNVDSVTIENIKDEEETNPRKKEAAPEYVPEDGIEMKEEDDVIEAPVTPAEEPVPTTEAADVEEVEEVTEVMTEAKKEKDPKEGRQFVLKTPSGYVSMEGNALTFRDDPKKALHFIVGKEESGLVHLSGVEKILDTMGVYDVQKYYKNEDVVPPAADVQQPIQNTPAETEKTEEACLGEGNTRFVAEVRTQGADEGSSNVETVPVSGLELEAVLSEVSNLWQQKAKGDNANLMVVVKDTQSGEEFAYNPTTNTLDPMQTMANQVTESDDSIEQDGNTLTMQLDPDAEDSVEIEKEFDTKAQADAAKAGMEQEKVDGSIMLNEEDTITPGWYIGIPNVGISGPFESEEEAWKGMEQYKDIATVQYLGEAKQDLEEDKAGAALGAGLGLPFGPLGALAGGAIGSGLQDYFSKKPRKPGWKAGAIAGGLLGGPAGALIGGGLQHMLTGDKGTLSNMGNAVGKAGKAVGNATAGAWNNMKKTYQATRNKNQPAQVTDQTAQQQLPAPEQAAQAQAQQQAIQPTAQATQAAPATQDQAQQAQPQQATQDPVQAPVELDLPQQVQQVEQHVQQVEQQVQQVQQQIQQMQKSKAVKKAVRKPVAKEASMDEKLYTDVSEPSDPVVDMPLEEVTVTPQQQRDFIVTNVGEDNELAQEANRVIDLLEKGAIDVKDASWKLSDIAYQVQIMLWGDVKDNTVITEALGEDVIVNLGNIDWDIDSLIDGTSDDAWEAAADDELAASDSDFAGEDDLYSTISNLPETLTVRLQGVNLKGLTKPDEVKQAIIAAANEQTPYRINDAEIKAIY